MPNVLSPRDLVSRPDNMDETVLHTYAKNRFSHDTPIPHDNTYISEKTLLKLKVTPPKKSSCLYVCQHCLVHLGDIGKNNV